MLKQQLNFKLSQKLSPQQIQLMKLIQLPTQAFEQRISQEIEENPALEGGKEDPNEFEDDFNNEEFEGDTVEENDVIETQINIDEYLSDDETPNYKLSANNYSADDEDKQIPYASGNEGGYIRRDLIDIVDDLAFTQNILTSEEKVFEIIKIVQNLDPAGVGAKNLQECLLIQLKRKNNTEAVLLAIKLIEESFDQFSKKHYDKILSKHSITEDHLRAAIHEIEILNPKPGGSYASNSKIVEHVVPDFTIRIQDGDLQLTLNGRNAPDLHVSRDYSEMLKGFKMSKQKTKSQKDAVLFIKQKLDAAKWFIDAIKQRQQTLFITMNAIMYHQKEYFLTGDEQKLKPMILKNIADEINMDVSTVSRVANSKYVDTPYGTKLIKEFFSESMKNDKGEDVSTREIKNILENIILEEDKKKPYTDDKLAEILKNKGYPIARRTIAKYREQLEVPVARLRKKI